MVRSKFGQWEIEYDREATRDAYSQMIEGTGCNCAYCRNYDLAVPAFPPEVLRLFDQLGVDPAQPSELGCGIAVEKGTIWYTGWYHLVGRYISGQDWHQRVSTAQNEILVPGYEIGFTRTLHFVPEEIPEEQALQMEVSFLLPWLLEEPYEG